MVNETKVTSRNAFSEYVFVLESDKDSKNGKITSFETARGLLTSLLTFRPRMPHICFFSDSFSFSHFLTPSCLF